jgi:hydrogenase expression/formation protein HypE
MSDRSPFAFDCPLPQSLDADRITLAYGEGGRLSRQFVRERILSRLANPTLAALGDAAVLTPAHRLALTTDGYTVTPLIFPGGDIGRLAVFGAVNDLVVVGATPRWLSLALILEEGLPWAVLDRVLDSVRDAASEAGILVVTGDTKVVPRGTADQLFITTAGLGEFVTEPFAGPDRLQVGDVLLVSGPMGQHGAAVLCAREELGFDPAPVSDCASLAPPLLGLAAANLSPRAARDATRGGVAAVLHEWAAAAGRGIEIDESRLPVSPPVRAVCELLGLDPLFLACEGTSVAAVPADQVEATLSHLRQHAVSRAATVIGRVTESGPVPVCVRRAAGRLVPLDEPAGSPLPRIC